MPRPRALPPIHWPLLAGLMWCQPAYTVENDQDAQIQEDCRIEGEMAGLQDQALDEFIVDCVADLSAVEFGNMTEPDR